eukprot:CAMPEP_0185577244 /NCGR_PEP_ID=MMETSP0434-20130131/9429_1 /TAXON_ID=626734 ORGANISM="Favella taraikaensis, Strain Fe Narragansett Bay" /NCGR_SAMPLE_ID=MMETSP0434 /ASSEMBLY_ACC=CAM_ASM_000379 /LENGTH=128 /DNA_ID=CAMNT_0028194753 /DNA_START=165 /DNA_END=551 /DNA_ORIENTATION=+
MAPLIALYVKPDSYCVRMWNFVWQCVQLSFLIIMLILAIVGIEALIALLCSDSNVSYSMSSSGNDQDFGLNKCESYLRTPVYTALAVAVLGLVPLQILWVRVFKAHLDDLKQEGETEYTPIPSEDLVA